MRGIVFKTISENIRSFFGKEDELLADPKAIPEPASDVFEHPGNIPPPQPKKIVDKPLPSETPSKLPFSPDDLRSALKEKVAASPPKDPPPREDRRDITHEIDEFESSLSGIEEPAPQPTPSPAQTLPPEIAGESSFFDEYKQFIMHEDLDAKGAIEGNILEKMKEFHKHHNESDAHMRYTREVQDGMEDKLAELKTLEHEWFHTRQQLEESQRGIKDLEKAIQERSGELQKLVGKAKGRKKIEKRAPVGKEFFLSDGRRLTTVLDLRIALQTMPEDIFRRHVSPTRNDFASWVNDVLDDEGLAISIKGCKQKFQLQELLNKLTN